MHQGRPDDTFVVNADDLVPSVRVRLVAMRLFAEKGFAATTVRDVARDAGVTLGLLQHHYPAKSDVRRAVDDHVAQIFRSAFDDLPPKGQALDFEGLGARITAIVREHPHVVSYVMRSASDGDEAGTALIDAIVQVALHQIDDLARRGLVRDDIDREWAAISVVVMSMSTIMFRRSVENLLGRPFLDDAILDRWNAASINLFRSGIGESRPDA